MTSLRYRLRTVFPLVILLAACIPLSAQNREEIKMPPDVAPFVEKGTKAIALETADLNGDGRADFILVLEKQKPEIRDDFPVNQRPMLILAREADGVLRVAKRNERVVMCSQCGGVFGDPFESIEVGRNTFTIHHYGGSNWRWVYKYRFNYSRIDRTWQLVRVEDSSYHTSDPNKAKTSIYTPPRHFGKIDFAGFDPENYLKKGVKRPTDE